MTSPPDSGQSAAPARPAATVMALREAADGVEVLVIRRHEKLAFMGGLWVFPGGTLCEADSSTAALSRIPEQARRHWQPLDELGGSTLDAARSLGLAVAACRETFEETGILLARGENGEPLDAQQLQRLQGQRCAVTNDARLFAALLQQEHLLLEVRHLVYWAHWITPSNVPRRFDTRFFAIAVPGTQRAVVDQRETIDHAWLTPAALLAAAAAGSMALSHPTLYNLMALDASLQERGSLAQMLMQARERQVVPVLPKLRSDASTLMVLPWDAEYREIPGENAPQHIAYPRWLRALPSRVMQ